MWNLNNTELGYVLISVGSLLLLSRTVTAFTGKISVPAVLGEILLGILIGPTFLGTVCPPLSTLLFPTAGDMGAAMQNLSQFAVISLLFVAGLETNLKILCKEGRTVVFTTLGSSLIPFVAGFLLVWLNPELLGVVPNRHALLSVFMGIAFSISALPVIIRILMDLKLYRSKIGVITVATASIMDIIGWTAFTLVLNFLHPFSLEDIAKIAWSHSTLLSFIAGIVVGNSPYIHGKAKRVAYEFVVPLLSPLFFLSIGAKVNFITHWDFALIITVIAMATISKLVGSYLGGKLGGLGNKEALAVGIALNVRGAMEIILSKQALDAGLIQLNLFVALVVMALFTSMLSAPAMRFLNLKQDER